MKRLDADSAGQDACAMDPPPGDALDARSTIDPNLLPRLDSPISPALQRTISAAVSDAIAANLSLRDACDQVASALARHGIVLSADELAKLVSAESLGVS